MLLPNEKTWVSLWIILSVLFFVVPEIIFFVKTKVLNKKRKKSEIGGMLIFSVFLIAAIWWLRYAVCYFQCRTGTAEASLLAGEEFLYSLFTALKTFGVDEGYPAYINSIKVIADAIMPASYTFFNATKSLLLVYASVLDVLAPVAGGAIIFEILASIFPKVKMCFTYLCIWRNKYFFSELNKASIALANGIHEQSKSVFKRPVLIFTDAYVDKDDEKNAELFQEAKALGAICVKDDITHVWKNRFGRRFFLLLDENESANLLSLTNLADKRNAGYLKKAEIFFVTTGDSYVEIEKRIQEKLQEDFHFDKEKELPTFIPVKSYRNLISNLLEEIPLFEPLIDKQDKSQLTVTILGAGQIGTEMFLTTYWIGQILNTTLQINVVSEETEEEFWNKIDYINPEIRQTTIPYSSVLKINKRWDKAAPYCKVNYICCDAKTSVFIDQNRQESTSNLLDTDYFFISLGADDLNISVANTIKNEVGKYHISKNAGRKAVITYVVYEPSIAELLNRKTMFTFEGTTHNILMRAVGNLNDVYSIENVFFNKHDAAALQLHDAYLSKQGYDARAQLHKKRMEDDYKYWANIARRLHVKYKMFSMGIYYNSVFNFNSPADEEYAKSVAVAAEQFNRIVSGKIDFEKPEDEQRHIALLHEMAWLEHRRWNAFTRVKGFRHTEGYDAYAVKGDYGSYKQMDLKLHPCLVECDKKGIRAQLSADGKVKEDTVFKSTDHSDFDLLDDLSYDLKEKGYNDYDFKMYDYPVSHS